MSFVARVLLLFAVAAALALTPRWALGADAPPRTAKAAQVTYQGKPIRWWAKRAVQARKDANARGRTIRRLQAAQRREAAHFFQWLANADCIYRHERGADGWATRTGNGYYGGLQADLAFQRAYGLTYLRRWGTADSWPWWAQLHMGYRGWLARGWQPWPLTSKACGLR